MARKFINVQWDLPSDANGRIATWQAMEIAMLMDIRDELQKLNHLLGCQNFIDVPRILRGIEVNTKKPKRKARGGLRTEES